MFLNFETENSSGNLGTCEHFHLFYGFNSWIILREQLNLLTRNKAESIQGIKGICMTPPWNFK